MEIFLAVIGGVVCAVIFLLITGIFILRLIMGRKTALNFQSPARINLRKRRNPTWDDPLAAHKAEEAFKQASFADAGAYTAPEMPSLSLHAFAHPDQGLYGVVYEMPPVGVWVDIVSRFEDRTSLTVTNAPQGQELDHRPGHEKIYHTGLDTAELLRRTLSQRPQKPLANHLPGQFATEFQHAYAEEMDWRNSRGGPSEAEIRRVAAHAGIDADEKTIAEARAMNLRAACRGLDDSLREQFVQHTKISVSDWEKIRERIVYIHDQMPPDMIRDAVNNEREQNPGEPESSGKPENKELHLTPRALFAQLNAQLPEPERFTKLDEVNEPVPADVYVAPEDRRET